MSNIVFLPNNVADLATASSMANGSEAVGYSRLDTFSGPRSTYLRTQASTADITMRLQDSNHPASGGDLDCTHVVVVRADWIGDGQETQDLYFQAWNNGGASFDTFISEIPFNTDANYGIGPREQDYCVKAASAQTSTAFQVNFINNTGSPSRALKVGKVYFSNEFDPGTNPDISGAPRWVDMEEGSVFTPRRGDFPYEVEARISLSWKHLTDAIVTSFEAMAQYLNWPLFLFDDSQYLWDWKLEHVLIETYEITRIAPDTNTLTVTFLRLRHYP